MIILRYTPDVLGSECCQQKIIPVFGAVVLDVFNKAYVRYQARIVGHLVTLSLSTGEVDGYDESDRNCYWTISAPTLGIYQLIEIDHVNVTCLGVPEFSISNVLAFGSCLGSISADNFNAAKLPFGLRQFDPDLPDDGGGLSIPIDDDECPICQEVPRYLCAYGFMEVGGGIEAVEFEWQIYHEPFYDEFGVWYIGVWSEMSPKAGAYTRKIWLIKEFLYGDETVCSMRMDFKPGLPSAEIFRDLSFDDPAECACKIGTNVLAVDPGDLVGFRIQSGRCGCWGYFCGTCRCVPQALCGYAYIGEVFYRNIRFEWDADSKSWISSGGIDINGYPLTETLTISLGNNANGDCELVYERYGFNMLPQSFGCTHLMNASWSSDNASHTEYSWLFVSTALGDCNESIVCSGASPCAENCGSHPEQVKLILAGWNDPYLDEPGIIGSCDIEIDMFLIKEPALAGETLELPCRYKGFYTLSCDGVSYVIEATIFEGELTLERTDLSTQSSVLEIHLFDYETCNPYYAERFEVSGIKDCLWGCNVTIQRFLIEVMEQ
tara:strand:+ start:197 stop:1843 length:1647 start_codon:yes stop_codon:yes gene_type:complete